MSKVADRIKALQRQREAALAPSQPAEPEVDGLASGEPPPVIADVQAHFGGSLAAIVNGRQIQAVPVSAIAPDERPMMRQPRLLPPPSEIMRDGQTNPEYADLAVELLALGQSLQQRQIQPIVIYPGQSAAFPQAQYLLLVGQRRWTAAQLVGLNSIEAIVVEPPSPADRVLVQYAENEDRADFSDMERAWALVQMKQALDDAPWESVEQRMQVGRSRHHQLTRLLAFSEPQQRLIARMRLQETQLRPLHSALRNNELNHEQVDGVLQRLAVIASARVAQAAATSENAPNAGQPSVDGPTIARLVARARREEQEEPLVPEWLTMMLNQFERSSQSVQRLQKRINSLDANNAALVATQALTLAERLAEIAQMASQRAVHAGQRSEQAE